jgi:hypothetical protein
MVHRRELDGEEIILGNQGDLFGNAMTWWDHETGSVWSQPLGQAILGPNAGKTLELLPSTLTSWESWSANHPDTAALDAPALGENFVLGQMAIVVDLGDETTAYPIPDLRDVEVVNDTVADIPIAVVIDPNDDSTWAVFSRRLDSGVVELSVVDGDLVDRESGTVFDPSRGIGRGGGRDGEIMDLLPGITAFPRDVETFWPDATFWGP